MSDGPHASAGAAGPPAEIERKYRVPALPDRLDDADRTPIAQGYLAIAEDAEVRLRRAGERRLLTVKRGHGRRRDEVEVEVDPDAFDALWPLTAGLRIEKVRHRLPAGELVIELDVYEGDLTGLVIAEVEFPSEAAADAFAAPGWLGPEVTQDRRYGNQRLARDGAPPESSEGTGG